jgi:hypothetical protein
MSHSADRTIAKIDEAIAIATKNGRRKDNDGVTLLRKLRDLILTRQPLAMTVDSWNVSINLEDITVSRTVLRVDLTRYDLGVASFSPGRVQAEYDHGTRNDPDAWIFKGYAVPAGANDDDREVIVDFQLAA